jgi:hypothetical protein
MVRRRSTVRFRKGAPGQRSVFEKIRTGCGAKSGANRSVFRDSASSTKAHSQEPCAWRGLGVSKTVWMIADLCLPRPGDGVVDVVRSKVGGPHCRGSVRARPHPKAGHGPALLEAYGVPSAMRRSCLDIPIKQASIELARLVYVVNGEVNPTRSPGGPRCISRDHRTCAFVAFGLALPSAGDGVID